MKHLKMKLIKLKEDYKSISTVNSRRKSVRRIFVEMYIDTSIMVGFTRQEAVKQLYVMGIKTRI